MFYYRIRIIGPFFWRKSTCESIALWVFVGLSIVSINSCLLTSLGEKTVSSASELIPLFTKATPLLTHFCSVFSTGFSTLTSWAQRSSKAGRCNDGVELSQMMSSERQYGKCCQRKWFKESVSWRRGHAHQESDLSADIRLNTRFGNLPNTLT